MAGTTPRVPELFRDPYQPIDFVVSELVSDAAGSHSPFGDWEFPVPTDKLLYDHPTAADRPQLADGR
jgi:hypothetical protein